MPKGAAGKKRPRYEVGDDPTLTEGQAKKGGFRPEALGTGGDFRHSSTPTLAGYSTGYHEASVTTDTFLFLRAATDNKDGTHTLPGTVSSASFFHDFAGKTVYSSTLHIILKYADEFRTDTAQTILAGPKATAA